MQIVSNPIPCFTGLDGAPLEGAMLYFGTVNQNPETNPTTVYWDSALTQPAAQPIRTIGGMPGRNGTPANIFCNNDYSLTVKDNAGRIQAYYADSSKYLSSANNLAFTQSGTGAASRSVQTDMRERLKITQFTGADPTGVSDSTSALTAAIVEAQSRTTPPVIWFPAGFYKITGPLPDITKAIVFEGENRRTTQLMCSGSSTIFNIRGLVTRTSGAGFRNIGLNGLSMTNGYLVAIDWAQDTFFENVLLADPYQGVSIRQAGNTTFVNVLGDKFRGPKGVYAYATNLARNGENDQIDVISFVDTLLQGDYIPGATVPATDLLTIDGRCHTIAMFGLRLLSAKRGLVTLNTPALPSNFVPRFFVGSDLEIESMYQECQRLEHAVDFWVDSIFAAGSATADGIYLGAGVGNYSPGSGTVNSNYAHGVNIYGANTINLQQFEIYNNSLVGANVKSGVYCGAGSKNIHVSGGLAGKATWLPAYTELQKFGVELDAAFNGIITVDGVDLQGNSTGPFYSNGLSALGSYVSGCPGYNPRGTGLQTVGASPYTYTADMTQESVNIYGGTGVVSTINGIAVANVSPCAFVLQPRQQVTISYATLPTMAVNKF